MTDALEPVATVAWYDWRVHEGEKALRKIIDGTTAFMETAPIFGEQAMTWSDEHIDALNALCEKYGCEAGSNRLEWLDEQLARALKLETALREARYFILAPAEDLKDGVVDRLNALLDANPPGFEPSETGWLERYQPKEKERERDT